MKLETLSGVQLGELVNRRELSPVDIVEYFQMRVIERNPSINAFTYTKFDDAYQDAFDLESRLMKGENCGPFAGVPVGLKDFLPSKKGWTNSHGGVRSLVAIDDGDSMFYTAAKELGAIAIGKTNAPAFGFSGACQNEMYGATRNPFDVNVTTGGSSGGSAAAVADGLLLLCEGGDAGGSIRIPSGWCNLFGFKPSLGTVPSYCRPDGWTATHPYCFNGALTKTVEDSAVMLSSMARYNPRDPISLPINAGKNFRELMKQSINGTKIGFTVDFDLYKVDPEVKRIVESAVKKFEDAGAEVDLIHFNFKHTLEEIMSCWCWSISVDTALDLYYWKLDGLDLIKDHADELPQEFMQFNEIASRVNIFDFRQFNEIRTDILDNFEDIFDKYDYIVSPTACCPPMPIENGGKVFEIAGEPVDPRYNFISFGQTPMVNFIGYPAASIPAGFTDAGHPIGMQIIGKQYRDDTVFAASYAFEQIQPWSYDRAFNRPL